MGAATRASRAPAMLDGRASIALLRIAHAAALITDTVTTARATANLDGWARIVLRSPAQMFVLGNANFTFALPVSLSSSPSPLPSALPSAFMFPALVNVTGLRPERQVRWTKL